MASEEDLLDLKNSKLIIEGDKADKALWSKRISNYVRDLQPDKSERKQIYSKRRDFYTGNQEDYSNIVGVVRDTKQKRGHTNQVTNYAGKTIVKIAFGIANNPPKYTIPAADVLDEMEVIRTQAVEDYIDNVLKSNENRFWRKTYRRAAFIQSEFGDAAVKVYPDVEEGQICIKGHDDMTTLMVGWNGEPGEYDFVIAEDLRTAQYIEDEYGIKVNKKLLPKMSDDGASTGSWWANGEWGTRGSRSADPNQPTGKNLLSKLKVQEFDSEDVYILKIEDEIVQLQFKDGITYPKVKYWTVIPNIPNPPSPWSIADIDYLMAIQIEINDNDNRSADHLRVGNVQRYVAYNMNDFNPESIKTSSGQVIFVNDPDGKSRFEPLETNINNFPDDQYNTRKMSQMFDMGLPKVNYGASGADSGRSKAIDYQSSIDLTQFKRDAWELALQDIFEKIQIFGNFLHQDVDWFTNADGEFVVREAEFDWTDILPVSQSEKIVNVANKVNMIGLSIRTALKELGYRDVDAEIAQIKKELQDPDLMILRAKMWQLSSGILQAQNAAMMATQGNMSAEAPSPNQAAPTLTSDQNTGGQPMASKGGTTAYSSAAGLVDRMGQNAQAKG